MSSETALRDSLAVERTRLANERTLLAYIRTGLTLVVAGGGMLQFLASPIATLSGWSLLASGVAVVPFGFWRFIRVRRELERSD